MPPSGRLQLCEDIPPVTTYVIGSNLGGQNVDPIFLGVISTYVAEHGDTFGGEWIDRDAGGTFVVAFTDNPEPHRVELAGRRPQPTDDVGVQPRPPIVDDRPLSEWDQRFDVVQVEFTEAELLATLERASRLLEGDRDRYVGAGLDTMRNRVHLDLIEPTAADLVELAETLPIDQVCVPGPLVTGDRPEPARFEPGDEINVIVTPGPDGRIPPDTLVTCDGSTPFPIAALDDPVPVTESDLDGVKAALNQFLASEEGVYWPQHGWRVLTRSDEHVELVFVDSGTVGFMSFESTRAGWSWEGGSLGGRCKLRTVIPAGLGEVEWRLDPAFPRPDVNTTVLHLLATERACASGQPMGDRLLGPQIVETDDAVLIAFAATTQEGGQHCQGNPAARVTVELPAPLDGRKLRDGRRVTIDIEQLIP